MPRESRASSNPRRLFSIRIVTEHWIARFRGQWQHEALGKQTMTEIRVPTLGESVTEATIGRWFKKPGDAVAVDEPLVELETDKVTIEVPAPSAGVLSEITVPQGTTVAVGAVLGSIAGNAVAPAEGVRSAEVPEPAANS